MTDAPNILLLWTDIETTGLNPEHDLILELAWQFTDYLGVPLGAPQSLITVDHENEDLMRAVLDRYMTAAPVVKKMHLDNNLWGDVLFRGAEVPRDGIFEVLDALHDQIDEHRGDAEVRLAGSSVHFDKRFLEHVLGGELPISHRVHDLSTLRPFLNWQGLDLDQFSADLVSDSHRALADIERDIAQWRGLCAFLSAET